MPVSHALSPAVPTVQPGSARTAGDSSAVNRIT